MKKMIRERKTGKLEGKKNGENKGGEKKETEKI